MVIGALFDDVVVVVAGSISSPLSLCSACDVCLDVNCEMFGCLVFEVQSIAGNRNIVGDVNRNVRFVIVGTVGSPSAFGIKFTHKISLLIGRRIRLCNVHRGGTIRRL